MEEGLTMEEAGVKANSRVRLIIMNAGKDNHNRKRARADKVPPLRRQGDHQGEQTREEWEAEKRVREAGRIQWDRQVKKERRIRHKEEGRISPWDKNKEGKKGSPSRETREKEAPSGSFREPRRTEAGEEVRPGQAGSKAAPPHLTPPTQGREKEKDHKETALE